MPNRPMPAPGTTHDAIGTNTPADGFTAFFRKAKALNCFPDATNAASFSHAFADRRVLRSEDDRHSPTITGDEAKTLWNKLAATPVNEKRAAYIHVPFCKGNALDEEEHITPITNELSSTYADAVIWELMREGSQSRQQGSPIHALYVGGGTPTALAPKDLARILDAARHNLPLANDCEITVEGRPSDMTPEMIRACIDAGANRFSLSVLTFQTELRRSMGRRSDQKETMETLSALMATNQAAVVIDLAYGLPDQLPEVWQKDLNILYALELDGAHLYPVDALTGPHQDIDKGALPPTADLPSQAALFRQGVKNMVANNYRRISASHWARTPRERNIYNLLLKQESPCLPLGSSAEGMIDGHIVMITDNLADYLSVAGREKPVATVVPPKENHRLAAHITGEMETQTLDLARLGRTFGNMIPVALLPLIHCWEESGLVSINNHLLRQTTAGEFWQTNLTRGLIDYLTLYREMGSPSPCI